MWYKIILDFETPVKYNHFAPFDGVLSYFFAQYTGCKYVGENELYKYAEELPLVKTYIEEDNKNGNRNSKRYFYNISSMLADYDATVGDTLKVEKYYITRRPLLNYYNPKQKFSTGSGKRMMLHPDIECFPPIRYCVFADIPDDRVKEFVSVCNTINFIGKKTGGGFGKLKRPPMVVKVRQAINKEEGTDLNMFLYKDRLIRCLPVSLIPERVKRGENFILLTQKLLPPYQFPHKKFETDMGYYQSIPVIPMSE